MVADSAWDVDGEFFSPGEAGCWFNNFTVRVMARIATAIRKKTKPLTRLEPPRGESLGNSGSSSGCVSGFGGLLVPASGSCKRIDFAISRTVERFEGSFTRVRPTISA
jgi:hypothetical protein